MVAAQAFSQMTQMEDSEIKSIGPRRKITIADLKRVNLGKSFWSSRTDLIQHEPAQAAIRKFRRNIVEVVATGAGMFIMGQIGRGKTSAAACLLKEAIAAGKTAYFVTHPEMRELRTDKEKRESLFGSGADGVTVRKKIETCEFLVLDGFDEPFFTDNHYGPLHLEELLTKRASEKLSTILTSRSGTFRHEKYASLFDVISQRMLPVPIEGKNLRDQDRAELKNILSRGGD
jgi:DNA replication protein DnaC